MAKVKNLVLSKRLIIFLNEFIWLIILLAVIIGLGAFIV